MTIKFGTDGWRGVIGDDFCFENVRIVAHTMARFYRDKKERYPGDREQVVIGYDTRFLGEESAIIVGECFAEHGIEPIVADSPVPTPCISYHVKELGLLGGIMVTASHNPAIYNGLKFKAYYGGTASTEIYERIENYLEAGPKRPGKLRRDIKRCDLISDYLQYVRDLVMHKEIGGHGWQILWDAMHGSSGKLFSRLFGQSDLFIKTLRSYPDPKFGGAQPEPILRNLSPLVEELNDHPYDIAFASDGDGDRLGVILPGGVFVTPHEVFALLALHMLETKGVKGGIAKTFSSSLYLDRIAEEHEVPLYETGIGFKYLCPLLIDGDVVIAGEESGGLAVSSGLPERDALVTASLLLESFTLKGRSPAEALAGLRKRFGDLHYQREDVELENMEKADKVITRVRENPPATIAGRRVTRMQEKDGVKLSFGEDGWLLLRKSGTEPLIRLYCELPSKEAVIMTLKEALTWTSQG